jgi:hypothetical protein
MYVHHRTTSVLTLTACALALSTACSGTASKNKEAGAPDADRPSSDTHADIAFPVETAPNISDAWIPIDKNNIVETGKDTLPSADMALSRDIGPGPEAPTDSPTILLSPDALANPDFLAKPDSAPSPDAALLTDTASPTADSARDLPLSLDTPSDTAEPDSLAPIDSAASPPNPCQPNPCANNGTCTATGDIATCSCLARWNPATNCTSCVGNWDPATSCTSCLGNWSPTSNCTTCLGTYNPATSCSTCLGNWNPSTNCTTCLSGWTGMSCNIQDLCAGVTCSSHGTCSTFTGACICAMGYVGLTCNSCASGYAGYPTCAPIPIPTITGLAIDCSRDGVCLSYGLTYPVAFSATNATTCTASVKRVTGSGTTGSVSPCVISGGAGSFTYTTGSTALDIIEISVIVSGPGGFATPASINVTLE